MSENERDDEVIWETMREMTLQETKQTMRQIKPNKYLQSLLGLRNWSCQKITYPIQTSELATVILCWRIRAQCAWMHQNTIPPPSSIPISFCLRLKPTSSPIFLPSSPQVPFSSQPIACMFVSGSLLFVVFSILHNSMKHLLDKQKISERKYHYCNISVNVTVSSDIWKRNQNTVAKGYVFGLNSKLCKWHIFREATVI